MHVGLATGFAHQRGKAYDDARFVREEVENLILAEELGFDSVWITEHHFSDYSMSNDPLQLLTYIAEISPRPVLFIAGEVAHSRYFSEDAFKAAKEPKELVIVPGANHVDLYDRPEKIPFDRITAFFKAHLS